MPSKNSLKHTTNTNKDPEQTEEQAGGKKKKEDKETREKEVRMV